jgi:ubiquinone/menaquinone biosynthesis C-methylase UbiE
MAILVCRMNTAEYQKLAEVEDRMWYFRSLHGHMERELVRALPAEREARVLDAGCGTGGLILRLRERHPAWTWSGIDLSAIACDYARQRTGGDIREASIVALPFSDGEFDAVVSTDVVCQVDDPAAALAELFRVLRPGGLVALNMPAYMWLWSYHDAAVQNKRRYTRPEVHALLVAAGFRGVRATHWNALPFPLLYARRKFFRPAGGTSDVKLHPAPVELGLRAAMAVEHAWLRLGGRWAWGASVFAVGHKPLAENRL